MSSKDVNQRMKHLNCTLNHFWRRWRGEYLLQLRECHGYNWSGGAGREPHIGVVLLRSDNKLRGLWKLARVQQVLRGKDGCVRGAVLQVPSGDSGSNIQGRPLQYLHLLEVDCKQADTMTDAAETDNGTMNIEMSPATQQECSLNDASRLKRAAMQKANDFIWAVISEMWPDLPKGVLHTHHF